MAYLVEVKYSTYLSSHVEYIGLKRSQCTFPTV